MGDLSRRELATVLAALRYWQREGWRSEGAEHDIATVGGIMDPMALEEIDALCERLNFGIPRRRKLADSPTTEYRYCLDALIATINDMKVSVELMEIGFPTARLLIRLLMDISRAKRRVAELAGRLHEKWIVPACDGNHAGDPCGDPECWQLEPDPAQSGADDPRGMEPCR